MDTMLITKPVHRLEVFTGAGRWRSFSYEEKARIVAITNGSSRSSATTIRTECFFVHHGMGSEGWSDDGFSRSAT